MREKQFIADLPYDALYLNKSRYGSILSNIYKGIYLPSVNHP